MDLLDVFVRAGQSVSRWPEIQEFVDVAVVDITVAIVVVLVVFGAWVAVCLCMGGAVSVYKVSQKTHFQNAAGATVHRLNHHLPASLVINLLVVSY